MKLRDRLKTHLAAGILILVPIIITFYLLQFLFRTVDGILSPLIARFLRVRIPGLGVVLTVCLIYFTGLVASNFLGRRLIRFGEGLLGRVPFIKNIYQAAKQFVEAVTLPGKMTFKRVVYLDYPRPGLKAIGFVTGQSVDQDGRSLVHVFIPTTPNPTGGMLEFLEEKDIQDSSLSVEEAVRLVVSGGILTPQISSEKGKEKRE